MSRVYSKVLVLSLLGTGLFASHVNAASRTNSTRELMKVAIETSILHDREVDPNHVISLCRSIDTAMTDEALCDLAGTADHHVREYIARLDNTSQKVFDRLVTTNDEDLKYWVAVNPSVSLSTLSSLAKDSNPDVRRGVAENSSCPLDVLTVLSTDSDHQVRKGVVRNWAVPVAMLTKLAQDKDPYVRNEVAQAHNVTPEVLAILAHDQFLETKQEVAHNPKTTAETLTLLFKDRSAGSLTRTWIAEHKNTPISILEQIAKFPDDGGDNYDRRHAQYRLEKMKNKQGAPEASDVTH